MRLLSSTSAWMLKLLASCMMGLVRGLVHARSAEQLGTETGRRAMNPVLCVYIVGITMSTCL